MRAMGEAVGADGLRGRTWRRGGVRWPRSGRGEGKRKSGTAGRAPVRARRRARCANHSGRRTDSDAVAFVALDECGDRVPGTVHAAGRSASERWLSSPAAGGSIAVGSVGRRTEHGRRPGTTERWRPGLCSRRRQVSDNDGQPGPSSRQLFSITMNPPWDALVCPENARNPSMPYPPPPSPLPVPPRRSPPLPTRSSKPCASDAPPPSRQRPFASTMPSTTSSRSVYSSPNYLLIPTPSPARARAYEEETVKGCKRYVLPTRSVACLFLLSSPVKNPRP